MRRTVHSFSRPRAYFITPVAPKAGVAPNEDSEIEGRRPRPGGNSGLRPEADRVLKVPWRLASFTVHSPPVPRFVLR
jgi:hypothetical protein